MPESPKSYPSRCTLRACKPVPPIFDTSSIRFICNRHGSQIQDFGILAYIKWWFLWTKQGFKE